MSSLEELASIKFVIFHPSQCPPFVYWFLFTHFLDFCVDKLLHKDYLRI